MEVEQYIVPLPLFDIIEPPPKRQLLYSGREGLLSSVIEPSQQPKRVKTKASPSFPIVDIRPTYFDWYNWRVDGLMGKGSFGSVWKIHNVKTGEILAIKFFNEEPKGELEREATVMALLSRSCPQLVKYKGVVKVSRQPVIFFGEVAFEDHQGQGLLMEFVPGSNLYTEVKKGQRPNRETLDRVTLDLLKQLACVHSAGIVHQDISSKNIIYNAPAQSAKLIDYGLGCAFGEQSMTLDINYCIFGQGGTRAYWAPEQWEPGEAPPITPASDVFSLGIVLAEWYFGDKLTQPWNWDVNLPFPAQPFVSRVQANPRVPGYLKAMLTISPKDRPTAEQLVQQLST